MGNPDLSVIFSVTVWFLSWLCALYLQDLELHYPGKSCEKRGIV